MKRQNYLIPIGLMLFALFFGAGNLIFPIFMGQNSGSETILAIIGFLLTGVGFPILAVAAIGYSGNDLEALTSRVHPGYAIFYTVALYLTIGPAFAIPRTATTSFSIAIAPFFTESMQQTALCGFAFLFFLLSWWLASNPSKLVARIGKLITPALLVFLAILFISATISPIGPWQAPRDSYAPSLKALTQGFLDGYNTMDALAGFVFGIIVVNAVRQFGAKTNEEVATDTLKSGIIAGFCLAVIYVFLAYIGASSVSEMGIKDNGADVLVAISVHYFGSYGRILMGLIVLLACLTTSVGLITACGEYFNKLLPVLSYKMWATLFSVISFVIALCGLSTIIAAAVPVLMFLYPLTISLIFLTFGNSIYGGARSVYVCATLLTLLPALYDGCHTAGLSMPAIDALMQAVPLSHYGLGWICFFAVGVILGMMVKQVGKR